MEKKPQNQKYFFKENEMILQKVITTKMGFLSFQMAHFGNLAGYTSLRRDSSSMGTMIIIMNMHQVKDRIKQIIVIWMN